MNVNAVSFGRVLKLNHPAPIARRIADTVNSDYHCSYFSENAKKQLKEIFYDVGPAELVYTYSPNPETSYLISGQEAKKFEASRNKAFREANMAIAKYGHSEQGNMEVDKAWQAHIRNVGKIISNSKDSANLYFHFDVEKSEVTDICVGKDNSTVSKKCGEFISNSDTHTSMQEKSSFIC